MLSKVNNDMQLIQSSLYVNITIVVQHCWNIVGDDRKSLRTFAPGRYRVFWNYSPRQIPRQIPVPICLD